MKTVSIIFLVLAAAVSAIAQTRTVEGNATGRVFNEFKKGWLPATIEVYVDDEGSFYTCVSNRTSKPRAMLPKNCLEPFITALEKSKEWAKTANTEQLEITKSLGKFADKQGQILNSVVLEFFSTNKGKQTDVILSLSDFDNRFEKAEVYVSTADVDQLLVLLRRVESTYKELLEQKKKADLLK